MSYDYKRHWEYCAGRTIRMYIPGSSQAQPRSIVLLHGARQRARHDQIHPVMLCVRTVNGHIYAKHQVCSDAMLFYMPMVAICNRSIRNSRNIIPGAFYEAPLWPEI